MATEDELRIAQEIMNTVRRLQLPLQLDEITEGRGNCFPLSVLAQCRRQEIKQHLTDPIKSLMEQNNPTLLRRVQGVSKKTVHCLSIVWGKFFATKNCHIIKSEHILRLPRSSRF